MPISRERCTTETTSTLAMPSATDRPTKPDHRVRRLLRVDCGEELALVLIQLSARMPVMPWAADRARISAA
jgi:hypothetical protein